MEMTDSSRRGFLKTALAGGALLDIGVYGVNFACMHFGSDIDRIESSVSLTCLPAATGLEAVVMTYSLPEREPLMAHMLSSEASTVTGTFLAI